MNGSPPSFLENSCISGALAKLQDQAVNLATNLVERKQTEELVGDTINIIRRSIQLFKDKKPASWNRLKQAFKKHPLLSEKRAGQVPDEWLKLQYGWNPLMSDVQGAFSKIERREADGLADRVTVKKLVRYSALTSPTLSTGIGGTSLLLRRDSKYLGHISLTYRLTNFPLAQFSSLGLVNPAYLIWEELPFSFVIDWFAPIGNVLNSWTADFGWTYMGGCFSSKVSENLDTARCNSNTSGIYTYSISGNVQGFSEIFSRKVYASSPVARFYLKNPLSSLHVSEALSLLIQVFR
nr:MAG: hypothetical protein 1 [Leviviridae sp.]